jgi:hypothetical protein
MSSTSKMSIKHQQPVRGGEALFQDDELSVASGMSGRVPPDDLSKASNNSTINKDEISLAKEEKNILRARILFLALMLGAAAAFGTIAYVITSDQEQNDFQVAVCDGFSRSCFSPGSLMVASLTPRSHCLFPCRGPL